MRELDLKDIKHPELFQRLCEELLSLEYSDFRAFDDTTGDRGCDGLAENDQTFFQMYYPDYDGRYSDRVNKIRNKITTDLKKLERPFPLRWILITPPKLPPELYNYIREKELEYHPMRILVWSNPRIQGLLTKHSETKKNWIAKIYGESIEVLPPESVTYAKRNNPEEIVKLNKKLGDSLQTWEHSEKFKQIHTYDSTGKANVVIVPKNPNDSLKYNVKLKFDKSEEGQRKLKEFIDVQKKGTSFSVDENFIDKVEIDLGGETKKELISKGDIAKLEIKPTYTKHLDCYIDLFKKRNYRLYRIPGIQFQIIRMGSEEILLNNFQQTSTKIKFEIFANRVDGGENKFNVKFDSINSDAVDGLYFAEFLEKFHHSTIAKICLNDGKILFEFGKFPTISKELDNVVEMSRLLSEIQDKVGIQLPTIFGVNLSQEQVSEIIKTHKVVTSGRYIIGQSSFRFKLKTTTPLEMVNSLNSPKGIQFKQTYLENVVNILGHEINLGNTIVYFDAKPDDNSRHILNLYLEKGELNEDDLNFVTISDQFPTIAFYPLWMSKAKEKIEEYERKSSEKFSKYINNKN